MNFTWLLIVPVFLIFCTGAYCTYTKYIRDSSLFTPIFISLSFMTGWLWTIATRRLSETSSIMLFSLLWDVLMIVAYYFMPFLLKSEKFNWQIYASAAVTITGICWFKYAINQI